MVFRVVHLKVRVVSVVQVVRVVRVVRVVQLVREKVLTWIDIDPSNSHTIPFTLKKT